MEKNKKQKKQKELNPLAIIRVRGRVNLKPKIKKTLTLLRLHKKNRCTVVEQNRNFMGMLNVVKDYCTFGEIDKEMLTELLKKRGRIAGGKPLTDEFLKNYKTTIKKLAEDIFNNKIKLNEIKGAKAFFKLHPPIGGFEREGIKKPYSMRGALGYRGKEINKMLRRMI